MASMDRALDTQARGIPAVTALTVRASRRWQASTRKQRNPHTSLPGDAYMPRAVVTGSGKAPRKRRTVTNPVVTYVRPITRMAPSNGGNPDA